MLYDRPYMRQPMETASRGPTVVAILLTVTIAVFVLQQVLNVAFPGIGGRDNRFFTEWFALSGQNFQDLKVWTLLSYAFLHSTQTILHILGNMLGLFFIGRMLEPVLGKANFLLLYFGTAMAGGVLYLVFHFNSLQPVVGASASVFGMLAFYCLLRPNQPITLLLFFVLPLTLKPKWIFWGALIISGFGVFLWELPGRSAMAHSAHLGGMLAGILYFRLLHNRRPAAPRRPGRASMELPDWVKRTKNTQRHVSYHVNRTTTNNGGATTGSISREALQKEVDRILDKINATGFGSLSAQEKQTLDNAKDILSR